MRIRNPQDFWAGLLFACFGAAALYFGQGYAVGAATRMGPGYLPTVLGWALVGMGAFIFARSLAVSGAGIPAAHFRPQFFIIIAIVAFAILIERGGLLVAAASVVALASFASRDARWHEVAILTVLVAAGAVGLFIYLLGQPMEAIVWNR